MLLFVYFIHAVSQALHANKLLRYSFDYTCDRIDALEIDTTNEKATSPEDARIVARADRPGYLNQIDFDGLLKAAAGAGVHLYLLPRPGAFVHYGAPLLEADGPVAADLLEHLEINSEVPFTEYASGFKHLTEVAVKACSPALNDPGTALTAVQYLQNLFLYLGEHAPPETITRRQGSGHFTYSVWTIRRLADRCLPELEHYLAEDPWTRAALHDLKVAINRLEEQAA